MSGELAKVEGMLAVLCRKLDAVLAMKQPPLTRKQFAAAANISLRTVVRKIKAREVRTKNGRIPHSELDKFLS